MWYVLQTQVVINVCGSRHAVLQRLWNNNSYFDFNVLKFVDKVNNGQT